MELTKKSCRLCLSESEFSISLFSHYSRKTNLLDKILVCLRLPIEENEYFNTICHRCVHNVELYHDFIATVKRAQPKIVQEPKRANRVTSYVREQVIDADYTFSFLEISKNEEKKDSKGSTPLFSCFSPPNILHQGLKTSINWQTPQEKSSPKDRKMKPFKKDLKVKSRQHSRDLFESQSQDVEEPEVKTFDWKLTPDDNIIKRVRKNFFGMSDF